jgi:hypothetical protein
MKRLAWAICFALLLPVLGNAQQIQLPTDLPEATLVALRAELAAARAAGLPTQPLVLKVLEGQSKGATGDQIVSAVRALRGRLRIAAEIFGSERPSDVIEGGAAALYVGVAEKTLRELARSTRPDAVGMALVVLGDLIRRGVPVVSAERAIVSLGAAGADARALSDFQRTVDDDIRTGLPPNRAAEVRLRGMLARFGRTGGAG